MEEQDVVKVVESLLELQQTLDRKVNAIGDIAVRADRTTVALAEFSIRLLTSLVSSRTIAGSDSDELREILSRIAEENSRG